MKKKLQAAIYFFILFAFVTSASVLFSQDSFEEYQKQQNVEFEEYESQADKEFAEFLKKDWEEFQAFQGIQPDKTPKPINPPKVDSVEIKNYSEGIGIQNIKPPKPQKEITAEVEKYKKSVKTGSKTALNIKFFGEEICLDYDAEWLEFSCNSTTQKNIADFWAGISKSSYKPFLSQVSHYRELMKLNDWAYYLLISKIAEELYSKSENLQNLFTWFVLVKSHYDVKVGFNSDSIFLLAPVKQTMYGLSFFTIEGKRYFNLSFRGNPQEIGKIYTYKGNYADADRSLDLNLYTSPNFKKRRMTKILSFQPIDPQSQPLEFPIRYNKNLVDFYHDYPQTIYNVYFETPIPPETISSLIEGLKPLLDGKSEMEAVNIILHFIQKTFDYKTDQEQFQREKCLFPVETIFYPFSDCEDRSVMFAYLVRKLLGLPVIGLDYPGHIATAVYFHDKIAGDYIEYNGKKYLICDPTYINANIGMEMPSVKNEKAEVIKLN